MNKFNCIECDFLTNDKTKYNRHLKTKKHLTKLEVSQTYPKHIPNISQTYPKTISAKTFFCKYCNMGFTAQSNMYRHIKNSCDHNTDESFKEMARLMNEIETLKKEMLKQDEDHTKKYEGLEKQLAKLNNKLQITNINSNSNSNNTNNVNNTIVIINSFDKPNMSQLTDVDVCPNIRSLNMGISNLVKNVYFNPKLPENHSIRVSNLKKEFATVFNGKHWDTVTVEYLLSKLHLWGEYFFEEWIAANGSDKLIDLFDKYMINLENNVEMQKTAKNNLLLICYNGLKMLNLHKATSNIEDNNLHP
jgi:uncharacterized C2H2 Zn-finger protein